jgi:metallo-beta-lactamase class B
MAEMNEIAQKTVVYNIILPLMLGLLAIPGCTSITSSNVDLLPDPDLHREAGRAASIPHFPGLASLCGAPSPEVTPELVASRPWRMPEGVAPTRVFDNVYFVGNAATSAWAIETSDGLIVVDTLNNAAEVDEFIIKGLQSLGLDPADIKYVVISHAHGDHSGGAKHLVEKFSPQVVMSEVDWEMVSNPGTRIEMPGWSDIPEPDITVDQRFELELGDTSIELILIPGHTMGTMATLIEVSDGENEHKAVLWGGTGFNFGPRFDQYMAYAQSAESMRREVLERDIQIFMSNHVRRDGADAKIAALGNRQPGDPHPFVLSSLDISKGFEVFRECALAQASELQSQN